MAPGPVTLKQCLCGVSPPASCWSAPTSGRSWMHFTPSGVAEAGRRRARARPRRRVALLFSVLRGRWFTRALARWAGKPAALAWLGFRKGGTFYFSTAENTALPLALLLKLRPGATLAFIGHRLTTPFKTRLIRGFNLLRASHWSSATAASRRARRRAPRGHRKTGCVESPFRPTSNSSRRRSTGCRRGVVSVGREMRD